MIQLSRRLTLSVLFAAAAYTATRWITPWRQWTTFDAPEPAFDRQYIQPNASNDAGEWWWFQAIGEPGASGIPPAFQVLFYQGYAFQFGPRDPVLPEYYLDIKGFHADGSAFSLTLPAASSRAWDVLRSAGAGDGDKVLDSILALFAALVAQAPRDLQEFAQKPDFVPVLCEIISFAQRGKDPLALVVDAEGDAELKKAGIGKPEKLMLITLRTVIIKKSGLCSSETCPPVRQLISQTLSALPSSSLQPTYFLAIYRSLVPELAILPSRLSAYTAGLRLLPDSSSESSEMPAFEHTENCLSILDSFLLGRWAETEEPNELGDDVINGERQEDLIEGLVTLCVVCSIMLVREEFEEQRDTANKCMESALRVLINLSHDNATWCKLLLRQELTMPVVVSLIARSQTSRTRRSHKDEDTPTLDDDGDHEGDAQAFDRLCLALGLLTNLVQADEGSAKDLVRATEFDPSCKAERACARACHCAARVNALEGLVRVYTDHRAPEDTDMDDPGAHIVTGHLAVLFGLLMRGSAENESIVLDALPGVTRRAKLDGLLGSVHEFAGLYREFMMRVARGEGKDDEEADGDDGDGATRGLGRGGSVDRAVRDGASEGVTQDVIELLQKLRDG
ncbi:hypothetical protein EWM64_g8276 [Hericium alpestre]|uniref:Wings apart-like protein C-terminal domain-containing protein n=1 Tax=Hericium alpestre TaxID=135208 RepID=A0A4Y9ZLK2_9AGAM|nr:hypothetical protein EWM64_g8276 [Hericium alpestre]